MSGGAEQGADGAALAAAGAHVAEQQTAWTQAKASAAAGELMFEPVAAEQSAAALDKLRDHMDEQLKMAQSLSNVDGFGATIVGGALSGKYAAQAEVARKVLTAHQTLLTDMAWTFRQAGKNYPSTDAANGRGVTGAG